MICKIFYRKVTGDVEKMRISKKEEKKCKIVETEKTKVGKCLQVDFVPERHGVQQCAVQVKKKALEAAQGL